MRITDKLADLRLLAIHSRLGNQEATAGHRKHPHRLEAMDPKKFPTAVMIPDAFERWCIYRFRILQEEIT